MSEAKGGARGRDTHGAPPREIAKETLLQMFREKFERLAPICRDRLVATDSDAVCTYHDSNLTHCRFSICPRLDLPLDVAADHLKKTEERRR